jgi:NAD(P)H-quinone oxidoreductase subunit 5
MINSNKDLILNSFFIVIAICIYLYVSILGSFDLVLITVNNIGALYLRFDALSSSLLLMIVLLGATIYSYSKRYLAGEKKQDLFLKYLVFVLISVCLFILSSNLITLFIFWKLTSMGLHRLLSFYNTRMAAVIAAQKRLLVNRIGDFFMLIGISLTYITFGTGDFKDLFAALENYESVKSNESILHVIALTFALGALIKSAQFPFQFWLPETMETPTPVSALMHAGIINGGGFLMIRLSPLLEHSFYSQSLLVIVGSFTAALASLIMITQNDIKRKLAYSTISQMGFMMVGCGLGLYSIALFHIMAHSFYKSHAFLSTGSLVQEAGKSGFQLAPLPLGRLIISSMVGLVIVALGFLLYQGQYFFHSVYFTIPVLGLLQNSGSFNLDISKRKVYTKSFLILLAAVVLYSGIEIFLKSLLGNNISPGDVSKFSLLDPVVMSALIALSFFYLAFWLTPLVMRPTGAVSRHMFLFLVNGCYFGLLSTKMLRVETNSGERVHVKL